MASSGASAIEAAEGLLAAEQNEPGFSEAVSEASRSILQGVSQPGSSEAGAEPSSAAQIHCPAGTVASRVDRRSGNYPDS